MFRHADPHDEDLQRIANAPGVTVLDQTVKRAMLVEGSEDAVEALREQLPDSIVAREVTYARPEPARERLADDPERS
jgi:hypothetical protein